MATAEEGYTSSSQEDDHDDETSEMETENNPEESERKGHNNLNESIAKRKAPEPSPIWTNNFGTSTPPDKRLKWSQQTFSEKDRGGNTKFALDVLHCSKICEILCGPQHLILWPDTVFCGHILCSHQIKIGTFIPLPTSSH